MDWVVFGFIEKERRARQGVDCLGLSRRSMARRRMGDKEEGEAPQWRYFSF